MYMRCSIAHLPAGVGNLATGLADYRLYVSKVFFQMVLKEQRCGTRQERRRRTVDGDDFSHFEGSRRLSKEVYVG